MSCLCQQLHGTCVRALLLALLLSQGCNLTKPGKWELVHYENFPHAAGIDPILFDGNEEGWALTSAELDRVHDKGKTWTSVLTNLNGERAFYSFTFVTEKVGFVVGSQKKGDGYTVLVLQTSDGGETWQERQSNVKSESDLYKAPALQSINFCGDKNGWAVGGNLILHTSDGGQTWQTQQSTCRTVTGYLAWLAQIRTMRGRWALLDSYCARPMAENSGSARRLERKKIY
jgi:hypothetical protein